MAMDAIIRNTGVAMRTRNPRKRTWEGARNGSPQRNHFMSNTPLGQDVSPVMTINANPRIKKQALTMTPALSTLESWTSICSSESN